MSYCRSDGKDIIIVATKEELQEPSKAIIKVDDDEDEEYGLILPSGEINWNCPCLGGMASGPCGVEFREAFSCFHYSQADPKGSDCIDSFRKMQDCMAGHPDLYPPRAEDEEGEKLGEDDSEGACEVEPGSDGQETGEESEAQSSPSS